MTTNGNKPAFPIHPDWRSINDKSDLGITKREYFAAIAMQGLIASGYYNNNQEGIRGNVSKSLEYADELIKQLNEPAKIK